MEDKSKYRIAIIGLGYVGLPLATLFSKTYNVLGYDNDSNRVNQLNQFIDKTNVTPTELKDRLMNNLIITDEFKKIKIVIYILLQSLHQ